MAKISVVINTLNEEKNLPFAIRSIKDLADEIVVVDMESEDNTVSVAKSLGAKVFSYRKVGYVEPARNFAISKATGDWILILDADERVPVQLVSKLKKIVKENEFDFVFIPRKNLIFGKWIKHCNWWPDYNLRFFKKGLVVWKDEIHSVPEAKGKGTNLLPKEKYAIVHKNYSYVSGYLKRLDRYTTIQSQEKIAQGYKFDWKDLIKLPTSEFFRRFFAGKGYKDGVHGLVLSILQSFSEFVVLIKVWEAKKFNDLDLNLEEINDELVNFEKDINYWKNDMLLKNKEINLVSSLVLKIKRKFKLI